MASFLSGLFGGRGQTSNIPLVPTVFGPEVDTTGFDQSPVPVVYGKPLDADALRKAGLKPNVWYPGHSTAVAGMMFQPYGVGANLGSVWVRFVGGKKRYNYPNVPAQEFVNFYRASSRGKWLNAVLRPLYSVGRGRHGGRRGRRHA